jgi:hypothetical protein
MPSLQIFGISSAGNGPSCPHSTARHAAEKCLVRFSFGPWLGPSPAGRSALSWWPLRGSRRNGLPGTQRRPGVARRTGSLRRLNELRRQLLEHNRRWRAGAAQGLAPAAPEAPRRPSGAVAPPTSERRPVPGLLSQPPTGHWSDPLSGSFSRTAPVKADAGLPSERITSPLTDADSRLSDRERSILRQQLRDSLRRQSGRENR